MLIESIREMINSDNRGMDKRTPTTLARKPLGNSRKRKIVDQSKVKLVKRPKDNRGQNSSKIKNSIIPDVSFIDVTKDTTAVSQPLSVNEDISSIIVLSSDDDRRFSPFDCDMDNEEGR